MKTAAIKLTLCVCSTSLVVVALAEDLVMCTVSVVSY